MIGQTNDRSLLVIYCGFRKDLSALNDEIGIWSVTVYKHNTERLMGKHILNVKDLFTFQTIQIFFHNVICRYSTYIDSHLDMTDFIHL